MTFLICPHCGRAIEKGLRDGITSLRNRLQGVVLTNVDGILEVGNDIVALFEEKHSEYHRIPTFQLITLSKVAKKLECPLYLVFTKDEFTVYEINLDQTFSGKWYYPNDDELVLIGDLSDFRNWIYREFLRYAPLHRSLRKFESEIWI